MTDKQYNARQMKFHGRRKYREDNRKSSDTFYSFLAILGIGWLLGKLFTSGWNK